MTDEFAARSRTAGGVSFATSASTSPAPTRMHLAKQSSSGNTSESLRGHRTRTEETPIPGLYRRRRQRRGAAVGHRDPRTGIGRCPSPQFGSSEPDPI